MLHLNSTASLVRRICTLFFLLLSLHSIACESRWASTHNHIKMQRGEEEEEEEEEEEIICHKVWCLRWRDGRGRGRGWRGEEKTHWQKYVHKLTPGELASLYLWETVYLEPQNHFTLTWLSSWEFFFHLYKRARSSEKFERTNTIAGERRGEEEGEGEGQVRRERETK